MVFGLLMKWRARSKWGFKDVVKNPAYWDDVTKARHEADVAAQAAMLWSDDRVSAATTHFLFDVTSSRQAGDDLHILRHLGVRTHPTLLRILKDQTLYQKLTKPTGVDLLPEAPFNRACDLLDDIPPVEIVDVLPPFLNDPSAEIRKDAALALAKTGATTISPLARRALSDPDEYVRSYILMGLEFALNRSGLAANLSNELFPDVLTLLRAGKNADKAADMLYRLDAERAKKYFLSPEVFMAGSPILHEILETLAKAKVHVPRERLLRLIETLEATDLKYPQNYALGEALRLVGQHQHNEDSSLLRNFTTHADEYVAQGAAAGLLCLFDLDGFERKILDKEKQAGFGALSEHQKYYSAVFMCDAEINNGGLAQHFVNSSGDYWREALAGFEAMGFREKFGALKEAIALFGDNGPSSNRSVRQDQLSKLYRKSDAIFEALDSRYYDSSEVVEVLTARFVLENPESFK